MLLILILSIRWSWKKDSIRDSNRTQTAHSQVPNKRRHQQNVVVSGSRRSYQSVIQRGRIDPIPPYMYQNTTVQSRHQQGHSTERQSFVCCRRTNQKWQFSIEHENNVNTRQLRLPFSSAAGTKQNEQLQTSSSQSSLFETLNVRIFKQWWVHVPLIIILVTTLNCFYVKFLLHNLLRLISAAISFLCPFLTSTKVILRSVVFVRLFVGWLVCLFVSSHPGTGCNGRWAAGGTAAGGRHCAPGGDGALWALFLVVIISG